MDNATFEWRYFFASNTEDISATNSDLFLPFGPLRIY
jgi:hypothetical protein